MGGSVNDRSNGYEAVANEFSAIRRDSIIGAEAVRKWSQKLEPDSEILELGCGNGIPISQTLVDGGFNVHGIDASPTLVAEFRSNFPKSKVVCEAVEDSTFFGRTFDGVVAWGLFFLLPENVQRQLIHRISSILKSGGRFLFTSPSQKVVWTDVLTGQESLSLGAKEYKSVLKGSGFELDSVFEDDGGNHYYDAVKI